MLQLVRGLWYEILFFNHAAKRRFGGLAGGEGGEKLNLSKIFIDFDCNVAIINS